MFHEQQLMISIVALEVEREKIEWKNLVEELSSMRYGIMELKLFVAAVFIW